jgi:RND family efflux transporter MFP subunit
MKWQTNRFCAACGAALAAATVAGVLFLCSGCGEPPARAEPPPPKVSVQHPELRKLVDYDQYNGWLKASDSVEIRSRVRGHLEKIHFQDGDMVSKDQLLFELDPRPFQAEVNRAADQVKIYEAQFVAASREEKRLKELVAKGGASQSQVDSAEAQTKSLEAQIEAQKQEVERRKLDLGYSRITAPFAGRISRANFSVGSLINAGAGEDVLTTLVSVDPIYAYFSIDERSLQRYLSTRRGAAGAAGASTQPGTLRESKLPFSFKLETEDDYAHGGVLDFADNRVDPETGSIEIRGSVKNENGQFVPGSRVSIRVPVSEERGVMLVPDTAILTDQSRKYVLALDEKKVVQRRDIELGKLLDDRMRVVRTSALKPEDWVITQGLQMARINYPVDPVMPTTQPAAAAAAAAAAR